MTSQIKIMRSYTRIISKLFNVKITRVLTYISQCCKNVTQVTKILSVDWLVKLTNKRKYSEASDMPIPKLKKQSSNNEDIVR